MRSDTRGALLPVRRISGPRRAMTEKMAVARLPREDMSSRDPTRRRACRQDTNGRTRRQNTHVGRIGWSSRDDRPRDRHPRLGRRPAGRAPTNHGCSAARVTDVASRSSCKKNLRGSWTPVELLTEQGQGHACLRHQTRPSGHSTRSLRAPESRTPSRQTLADQPSPWRFLIRRMICHYVRAG